MIAEDPALFYHDFGIEVVCGGESAKGIFDSPSRAMLDGMVLDEDAQVQLPASALPALAAGSELTVGGAAYKAREIFLIDDGQHKRVTLKRA